MFKIVSKNEYDPKDIDAALELIDELIACTRKEEGCISYELFRKIDDPNTMTFVETWESLDCIKAHSVSDHVKNISPKVRALRTKEYGIDVYELIK